MVRGLILILYTATLLFHARQLCLYCQPTGCYLKLHSTRGVVSSSHLPPQFERITSSQEHLMSPPLGCSLLLKIPSGSSFEFTLRKLKLLRPHSRECREDSQLQLATSTTWEPHKMMTDTKHFNSLHSSTWPNLAENHHWQVVRTFCGKIQDYSKSLRTWHTFEPSDWVLIRYRSSQRVHHHIHSSNGISNSFFVFKLNILGPCLNVLLTERSKTIEFSESDLSASVPECTFRVHVPYGYRIHLSAHLNSDNAIVAYENEAVDHPAVGRADESDENSLLTTNGNCQMTVQAEDITGHQTKCLNHRNPTASFSSLANFLKFQAKMLQVTSQGRPTQICMLKDKLHGIFVFLYRACWKSKQVKRS